MQYKSCLVAFSFSILFFFPSLFTICICFSVCLARIVNITLRIALFFLAGFLIRRLLLLRWYASLQSLHLTGQRICKRIILGFFLVS